MGEICVEHHQDIFRKPLSVFVLFITWLWSAKWKLMTLVFVKEPLDFFSRLSFLPDTNFIYSMGEIQTFVRSGQASPLLQSPVAVCFTPLQLTLCIALGDVRLGCSCSAMETQSMKLSTHCSWANLKATQSLEVCSYWLCRKLATSAHCAPQHALTPLCDFMWPTTSWLNCCCS